MTAELHEEDGRLLVDFARGVVAHALGGPLPAHPRGAPFDSPAATFVTLTRSGALHGCIGSIVPHRSLIEDVESNALAAAFADPRSPPLRAAWLPELGVEITLLSPLERIRFADEEDARARIAPGVDGLVLRFGRYQGTFLPQVWDALPDVREFLDELKQKAGLPRSFWDDRLELFRFRVQKWGDRRASPQEEQAREPRVVKVAS